jgi:acetate kinase
MGGRSIESTMGFTALDGLPMGTRAGQIDPGVVLYLAQEKVMSPRDILLLHSHGDLVGIAATFVAWLRMCNVYPALP